MTTRRALVLAAALAVCAVPRAGLAADAIADAWLPGTVTVITENDKWAFGGNDRHYTNGFKLIWVSDAIARDGDSIWRRARDVADWLPNLADANGIRVGLSIGQSLYTPGDTTTSAPIPDDRPYAGWLYGGFALIGERRGDPDPAHPSHARDRLDTVELQLGVVGPAAGGRTVQNGYHDLIGVPPANGWNNQIPNQLGVALYVERKWRDHQAFFLDLPDGLGADFMPHVGASVGNVATYAAIGGTVRVGRNLRVDYGPPRIRPALSGAGFLHRSDEFGWYFFAGLEGRAIAYDVTLDGWTVDPKPLVADFQTGVAATWRSLRFAYTYVLRSKEFDGQSQPDRFGALSLTLGF